MDNPVLAMVVDSASGEKLFSAALTYLPPIGSIINHKENYYIVEAIICLIKYDFDPLTRPDNLRYNNSVQLSVCQA